MLLACETARYVMTTPSRPGPMLQVKQQAWMASTRSPLFPPPNREIQLGWLSIPVCPRYLVIAGPGSKGPVVGILLTANQPEPPCPPRYLGPLIRGFRWGVGRSRVGPSQNPLLTAPRLFRWSDVRLQSGRVLPAPRQKEVVSTAALTSWEWTSLFCSRGLILA